MSIVVGYIPTPEGRAAIRVAADEARLRGRRLVVISSHEGGEGFRGEDEIRVARELENVRAKLDAAGVPHETHTYVRGNDPSEDLVRAAKDFDATLIVIGLRRRSPVGKLLLGSNAQRTLLDATCMVLAVHAEDSPEID